MPGKVLLLIRVSVPALVRYEKILPLCRSIKRTPTSEVELALAAGIVTTASPGTTGPSAILVRRAVTLVTAREAVLPEEVPVSESLGAAVSAVGSEVEGPETVS